MTARRLPFTRFLVPATTALAALSFAALAHADGCAAVEVQNLRPGQGPLMIAAYTDEASFGKTAASQQQVAVTGPTMQVQVCGLAGPSVAIMLFQDLNANGRLDKNPFGMPTEPWGASGKPAPMGPSWDSAQVPYGTAPIRIELPK